MAHLHTNLDSMRQIPTQGYYGKFGRCPYWNLIFRSLDEDIQERVRGPFLHESELVRAIKLGYTETPWPTRGEYSERILSKIFRGGPPVFSHRDLQRKNIIVRPDGSPVIIDWVGAAFCSRYWEYFTTMISFDHYTDDWHFLVGKMLDEYPAELS